jgi:hypothetical protein
MMRRKTENGIALIAALLFAMTVLALVTAVLSSGLAVRDQSRYIFARQGAQRAAESGVHLCLARLNGDQAAAVLAAGHLEGVVRGTGPRAPRYDVSITSGSIDGIDNDGDAVIDEPDEADLLEIRSTGSFDSVRRTVRVTLLARYETPQQPSAVHIGDPLADLNFNGNAFLISGFDVGLNGSQTGFVGPGIGVVGSPTFLMDQIRSQAEDNVIGAGGSPSVQEVPDLDLRALIEEGARSANIVLEGGSASPGEWGTLDAPAIVYSKDSVHISGGGEGAGILIVNGNLAISGSFDWHGLIVVRGQLEFKGGGGEKRLTGGLVIQNDLFAELPDGTAGEEGIYANGTIDILLSQQTIARMTQAFAEFTILNWREGPNPEEALP